MGRRRSKSKSRGVQGSTDNVVQVDLDSAEAPTLGPIVFGMQNASISTYAPILFDKEGVGAEDELKTSVYREDSVLSDGDHRKAVDKALESIDKTANVACDSGAAWSSQLRRLLLSRYNPPLYLWWAFTAAEKYVHLESNAGSLPKAAAIMDFISKLLVSLKALSAVNASGLLAIAALAPVVTLLHDVATSLRKSFDSSKGKVIDSDSVDGKEARKHLRKLRELVRETLCFVVICRSRDLAEFRRLSTLPSGVSASSKFIKSFYPAFPLASKHMNKALSKESLNSAVIAEVVSVELVILQLVVETFDWRSRVKKQNKEQSLEQQEFAKKIKSLARHSIYVGSTLSVSEMLLDVLLEKRLPVGSLLDEKEEKLVREYIIETVLRDPPLFGSWEKTVEKDVDLPSLLFMKKLAVGRRAIQAFRAQEDRKQADALSRRIASWQTPPQLMKWLQAQKKHLLPVTALLGSQAFLSWVASTFDEVAFTSIFDRCVKAYSPKVPTQVDNGEYKDDEQELEEDEGNLFFVDTDGDVKEDCIGDAAADLAFTNAAKDITKGKVNGKKGKERGPIYKRLPQEGLAFERGKSIIEEVVDGKADSDDDEDPTMVEDDSSAEDPASAKDTSSDDEPRESLASEVHFRKIEEKEPTEVSKENSGKVEAEKGEEEVVAKPTTPLTTTEEPRVTVEKDVVMEEVPAVPNDSVLLSKEVPRERGEDSRDTEVEHDRSVESEPIPDIRPIEKEDTQVTGMKDPEMGEVQVEPTTTQSTQEELSVEKIAEVSGEGLTKQEEAAAVPVLITSPTSNVDVFSAVSDSKDEQLPSQAVVEENEKDVENTAGMTQGSTDRDLETVIDVSSSASPTSKKKRGRKPKPRDPDGNIIVPPPTRRIATRGTTSHILTEKEEEKVDEDIGPVVLVTPHKNPRKSRRKETVQEPQEKVEEVAAEDPDLNSAVPSTVEQCPMSYANLIAAVETRVVPSSASLEATPSRGRKRTKVVLDDNRKWSPTPSLQATPSRGRKSTKAKVVVDDEVNATPTSSVPATQIVGRKSTKAPKVVTDDEAEDTPTNLMQATHRTGRKSTKAKVTTDDETDTTSTPPVQVTNSRIEKTVKAKALQDAVDFEEMSSPADHGTHSKGRKGSKSTDVGEADWMPPSSTKTSRKKGMVPLQPPEEDQEMKDEAGAVPVFTPRRSTRRAGAQVVGDSVDMALSPYRSSKKAKTKL